MLNGNAALSWEMALKIERAYGLDADETMRWQ
jgi:plasmid maintenance system antidote protein VapI